MTLDIKFKKRTLLAVTAVIEQINLHPTKAMTTAQFAKEANLSRKKFQAAFRHITNAGVQEYRLIRRMNFASQLLQEGQKPIKEIALICQFKSQRAFTTAFKKTFGMTPLEYQNKNS